jgi:hypothetical protein
VDERGVSIRRAISTVSILEWDYKNQSGNHRKNTVKDKPKKVRTINKKR